MSADRKVTAATLGAAVTTLIVGVLHRLGVDLTAVEQGALTTLVVFGAGYVRRSS